MVAIKGNCGANKEPENLAFTKNSDQLEAKSFWLDDHSFSEATLIKAGPFWVSLPISFAPFESLIFTSIIVPQASFVGHFSGIIVGYAIAWGLIHGVNNYWAVSMLGWIVLVFVLSLKRSGAFDFNFLEIESTDASLPSVRFLASGNGRTLQMSSLPALGADIV
ncbi:RHOMBOID-like protein 13 [Camellia lanceoleosa]|uniref:RHOMBOID-like protein 13 n=1 Tax=Camellia lanceoleosa TaxID=1840588 RepID=A0ACC0GT25_9ERIC|nr:RHOMBOID-like protein 13 [Camellia lanceoleosa]